MDQQWPEEGCFVFQIVFDAGLAVRRNPTVSDGSRTGMGFSRGDLISVDRIQPNSMAASPQGGDDNGPFLRLADQKGWLFERKNGKPAAKRLPVQTGLWAFYIDNFPAGIFPRSHPNDRLEFRFSEKAVEPLQKIYCDRKVVHPDTGVCWFRVQGTASSWVFDRRIGNENNEDHYMLLDENQVRTGVFAYIALGALAIRDRPEVGDDSRTGRSIRQGDIVVASAIRKSPFRQGNGPFLYLHDGSGWLFVNKYNEQKMKEIAIQSGRWSFRVLNEPAGLASRRHPLDDADMTEAENNYKLEPCYSPGSLVVCDRKIASTSGVNFYRIEGKQRWIFDRRDGALVLQSVSSPGPPQQVTPISVNKGSGWDIEFVRGIAATVPGICEIMLNETSRVISFRADNDTNVRVNVYYSTRTVGTALEHPLQGRTQLFRRDCTVEELIDILRNPRVHTGKGYQQKRSRGFGSNEPPTIVHTAEGTGVLVDVEEELRNDLLENDKAKKELQDKRIRLLKSIKIYDNTRQKSASARQELVRIRQEEIIKIQKARDNALKLKQQEQLKSRTCGVCGRVFSNTGARDQHTLDSHGPACHVCGRTFQSHNSLNQHKYAVNHW